mmetsp:Transcript_48620/g.147893  ORF Transcript_48620/g.147893 Transcript_48620/m.147893 type:complete len:323 (+) Transcript_48620:281-1249(+)
MGAQDPPADVRGGHRRRWPSADVRRHGAGRGARPAGQGRLGPREGHAEGAGHRQGDEKQRRHQDGPRRLLLRRVGWHVRGQGVRPGGLRQPAPERAPRGRRRRRRGGARQGQQVPVGALPGRRPEGGRRRRHVRRRGRRFQGLGGEVLGQVRDEALPSDEARLGQPRCDQGGPVHGRFWRGCQGRGDRVHHGHLRVLREARPDAPEQSRPAAAPDQAARAQVHEGRQDRAGGQEPEPRAQGREDRGDRAGQGVGRGAGRRDGRRDPQPPERAACGGLQARRLGAHPERARADDQGLRPHHRRQVGGAEAGGRAPRVRAEDGQ